MDVAVAVALSVGKLVDVAVLVRVAVAVGVFVSVGALVKLGELVGVKVAVGNDVEVGVCVAVGSVVEGSAAIAVGASFVIGVAVGAGAHATDNIKTTKNVNWEMVLKIRSVIYGSRSYAIILSGEMTMEITITEILDDLRAADEITRRFERRYWLSSADFYKLYSQGLLDDGEHTEDWTMWAAFFEIKRERETELETLSNARVQELLERAKQQPFTLDSPEPALTIPA